MYLNHDAKYFSTSPSTPSCTILPWLSTNTWSICLLNTGVTKAAPSTTGVTASRLLNPILAQRGAVSILGLMRFRYTLRAMPKARPPTPTPSIFLQHLLIISRSAWRLSSGKRQMKSITSYFFRFCISSRMLGRCTRAYAPAGMYQPRFQDMSLRQLQLRQRVVSHTARQKIRNMVRKYTARPATPSRLRYILLGLMPGRTISPAHSPPKTPPQNPPNPYVLPIEKSMAKKSNMPVIQPSCPRMSTSTCQLISKQASSPPKAPQIMGAAPAQSCTKLPKTAVVMLPATEASSISAPMQRGLQHCSSCVTKNSIDRVLIVICRRSWCRNEAAMRRHTYPSLSS